MPQVNKFKCNKCDFEMPSGWGGYMYVIGSFGARVIVNILVREEKFYR